mmetsp:Transcript_17186/g.30880  ORF Transcript_17186/g.30880 Transcript_17186/m.30880 type:complete len:144 (-) Transcript_17186:955-1386(-)
MKVMHYCTVQIKGFPSNQFQLASMFFLNSSAGIPAGASPPPCTISAASNFNPMTFRSDPAIREHESSFGHSSKTPQNGERGSMPITRYVGLQPVYEAVPAISVYQNNRSLALLNLLASSNCSLEVPAMRVLQCRPYIRSHSNK